MNRFQRIKNYSYKAFEQLKAALHVDESYETIRKKYLRYDAFSTLLHYESYDLDHEIYVNRDSLGFVFEIPPLGGADDTTYSQLQNLFQHTLPKGSNLQFLMIASPRLYDQYDAWENARAGTIYHELAKKRIAFLKENTGFTPLKNGFSPRDFMVIVSYSEPIEEYNKYSLEALLKVKKQVLSLFESVHATPRLILPERLKELLSDILDLREDFYERDIQLNPLDPLGVQMIRSNQDFEIYPNCIYQGQGKYCVKLFHVNKYPRHWIQSFMDHFIGDPFNDHIQIHCPFFLHYAIHIVDEENLKAKLYAKSHHVEKMAHSPVAKWIPSIHKENEEWQFVRSEIDEGQRVVRTRFQVGLFGESDYVLNEGTSQMNAVFSANKWGLEQDVAQLPSFLSCLPMSWGSGSYEDSQLFQKTKTVLSSEPVNLLPIQGEWKGTPSKGVMLFGRRGQKFHWSPFDNRAGNYNVCVLGKSGAGKSVFMQELMFSTLGLGGKVFVFDSGKSFKKITEIFEGEFIDFGEKNICINPFNFINGDDQKSLEDALIGLKSIIATMACNRDHLGDLEFSFIDQAIKYVWNHYRQEGSIDHIVDFLKQHTDKVANNLGERLFPYSSNGVYGDIFCGKSTLAFNKKITVLEMGGVNQELLEVVIQILITKINAELYAGDRKTPSHIFLDEGWKFLTGSETKAFINSSVRQLRKFNGSLVIGTQSLGDLFANEAASAAFENSDCICYLSQKSTSLEQHVKEGRLNVSEYQKKLLKSLRMKEGEYSEVMVTMSDDSFAIGRLKLDPFSNLLYSTKASEFEAVDAYLKQGFTITASIEQLLIQKGELI